MMVDNLEDWSLYLHKKGITIRRSYLHTHEQNGLIERKQRHLIENGLSLLTHASMPLKF